MTKIEVDGIEATIDTDRVWRSSNASLASLLNDVTQSEFRNGYYPHYVPCEQLFLADFFVKRYKGKFIETDIKPLNPPPGLIF
jgi:hypothetical protein